MYFWLVDYIDNELSSRGCHELFKKYGIKIYIIVP